MSVLWVQGAEKLQKDALTLKMRGESRGRIFAQATYENGGKILDIYEIHVVSLIPALVIQQGFRRQFDA